MEKINFNDIDFLSLEKLKQQGTKSTIYRSGDICFKFLDGLYSSEKALLYKKLMDMDGITIPNVLLPKALIIKSGKLEGYTMDYFKDSMPLSDKFMDRYIDCKQLFDYVSRASKILKDIHRNSIICQDLSFENILINKNGNIAFCDLDGCSYKKHIAPFISILIKRFIIDYRNENIILNSNLDRISMFISFYYLIYKEEIQNINKSEYHKLSKKISTLENAKVYANILIDKSNYIKELPYLDEIINPNDDYIIDRDKQLSLVKRLLKR